MKKMLSILFLLIALTLTAQTVTYQPNNTVISNPEKGFYHYTSTGSSGGYNLLTQSTLNGYRTNENITVIQRQFFLRDFITGTPITSTYLTNMQTDFNRIRATGAKVIVRFTYTSSDQTTSYQPTKAQILAHIQQLTPVITANKDVITCIQAGFIGQYGEWYYTNSTEFGSGDYTVLTNTQWANRKEVMDAMINSFPLDVPLQLRYIYAKQKMYGNAYIGRIGFYNDAFLAQDGDAGTFLASGNNPPSIADINYWVTNTTNLPVTGETNAVNAPRTNCDNTLLELNGYNWSLLNKDYLPANITNWQTQGCFTDIQKYLGYRFQLNNSNITNNIFSLYIANVGYANLFKERKAYLVLKNTLTNIEYSFLIDNNVKNWTSNNYGMVIDLNSLTLPNGTYKLYLNLPDNTLTNPLYSIQMANTGTWIASNGYNDLLQTWIKSSLSVNIFVVDNVVNIFNLNNYTFKIYNINGKLLKYNSLNISGLQAGVYIIKVKTRTGEVYTQKIIKT